MDLNWIWATRNSNICTSRQWFISCTVQCCLLSTHWLKIGWNPELVWKLWRREKSVLLLSNSVFRFCNENCWPPIRFHHWTRLWINLVRPALHKVRLVPVWIIIHLLWTLNYSWRKKFAVFIWYIFKVKV